MTELGKLIESRASNIRYSIDVEPDPWGSHRPQILGQGKFAFVFSGTQISEERGRRRVAIKILRPTANIADENLFDIEGQFMRRMLEMKSQWGIGEDCISVSEILQIEPLVMCGCGNVYVAVCPSCPGTTLVTKPPADEDYYHFLMCMMCGFRLSAEKAVAGQGGEALYAASTKPCCKNGPNCDRGHIINFKKRPAIVMNVVDYTLDHYLRDRDKWLQSLTQEMSLALRPDPSEGARRPAAASVFSRAYSFLSGALTRSDVVDLVEKASIVERLRLMVDLTTTIARLHSAGITHRDLAPDNVMIQVHGHVGFPGHHGPPAHSEVAASSRHLQDHLLGVMYDMVLHPKLTIQVIDFGLAVQKTTAGAAFGGQRQWYDEQKREGSQEKFPFWSPEAEGYRWTVQLPGITMTQVPSSEAAPCDGFFVSASEEKFYPADIVAVKGGSPGSNIMITSVQRDEPSGRLLAHFSGHLPINPELVKFEHVPRLGEAHDLFALGSIFFHLFVRKDENDFHRHITSFHDYIKTFQQEVSYARSGGAETVDDFEFLRKVRRLLGVKFWRDEIATIAINATIRGRSVSYAKNRAVEGPSSVQRMLKDIKTLYAIAHKHVVNEISTIIDKAK